MLTPALTFASNITSDDSSSLSSPQNNVAYASQTHAHKPSVFEAPHVHFSHFASGQLSLSLPLAQLPSTLIQGRETLGKTSNSSGKPSNDTENSPNNDFKLQTDRQRVTPSPVKSEAGYGSDSHYLSDSAGLKKSGKAKGKAKKGKPPALDLRAEREPGYSSDGGYLSASSSKSQKSSKGKSRAMAFFRRKPKKSQQVSDDEGDDIPPVPAMPPMPVPSSPRPLKHFGAPSSPTRSGFTPLKLNFNASPPGSSAGRKDRTSPPPARVVSPSPTPTVPRTSEQTINPMSLPSPLPPSTPARSAVPVIAHTPSHIPLTALSFSASQAPGTPVRLSPHPSSRNVGIRPAAPPPTQPLPQPPPFPVPTTPSRRAPGPPPTQALPPPPVQATPVPPSVPTTPPRRTPPFRPLPMAPVPIPPVQPLRIRSPVPRKTSPAPPHVMFRPQPVHTASDPVVPQRAYPNAEAVPRRYPSHNTVPSDESFESGPSKNGAVWTQHSGTPPLFLQRRMHGAQGFPRHPPPDSPLPQVPDAHHPHPAVAPSKFHEHFSSVSSMSHTHAPPALLTPRSASGSGSSSGPSVRSARSSAAPSVSTSSSHGRSSHHSGGVIDARPETSSSSPSRSETSHGKQTTASIAHSSISDNRSDVSVSIYCDERFSALTYEEAGNYNDPKGAQADDEDDDDDASFYPSDEKTAGRRTMYLVENGHALDDDGQDAFPPPLPPRRTGHGGYF